MHEKDRPTVALVTREFWPFYVGGGIGRYSRATAALLAEGADVTVVLPDFYAGRDADPRVPRGVRFEFVPEPNRSDLRPFASLYHAWSAAAYHALCRLYPDGGPDLVEFADYTGEGAVAVQAKRSGSPTLARTRIVVALHGTDEVHRTLNGQGLHEPETAALTALERIGLQGADVIFTPAGDVHRTYERYYGPERLARVRTVAHPFSLNDASAQPARADDGLLRLVHAGRYERRKGVAELVAAVHSLDRDDVRLTLVGRDTPTGPAGTSMRDACERLAAGDPRITFRDETDHAGVLACYAEHDVVVIPSRWETNANTAREALMVARPVLATPTGGLIQIVEHGVNGWLTAGTSVREIADGIERLLEDPGEARRLAGSEELRATLARSVQNEETLAAYIDEAGSEASIPTSGAVSVGVLDARPEATGNGALVLPPGDAIAILPPGAQPAPAFLERCAQALASAPDTAYATTWARADDPWQARPLGNAVPLVETEDCGGAVLVVRREHAQGAALRIRTWELGGGGAWLVARDLRARGLEGVVVPEELVDVRGVSQAGLEARREEVETALRRERMRWAAA
jgi:glycosyltransferase involved in cell wall biosynthesis